MSLRALRVLLLGMFVALGTQAMPRSAAAALTPLDTTAPGNAVEASQFCLNGQRVAGNESLRQSITAWRVTNGSWNGQSLVGLSLVLVETTADNGAYNNCTNCYVSHIATMAQRQALVSAFLAAKGLHAQDAASWRIEPSMIAIEINGQTVTIHLGLIS